MTIIWIYLLKVCCIKFFFMSSLISLIEYMHHWLFLPGYCAQTINWIRKRGVRRCTPARYGAEYLWMCVSECVVEDAREGSAERGNDWSFLPFTNCEGRETSPVQDIRHLIWFLDYIVVWTATERNILASHGSFLLFQLSLFRLDNSNLRDINDNVANYLDAIYI